MSPPFPQDVVRRERLAAAYGEFAACLQQARRQLAVAFPDPGDYPGAMQAYLRSFEWHHTTLVQMAKLIRYFQTVARGLQPAKPAELKRQGSQPAEPHPQGRRRPAPRPDRSGLDGPRKG
jgi:hypothetical protein